MTRDKNSVALKREIGSRLSELASDLNISVADLASRLGYSTDATLRQAIGGRAALGINKLYELGATRFEPWGNVNLNWLVCGQGAAFYEAKLDTMADPTGEELARRFDHLTHHARKSLLNLLLMLERTGE